MLLFFIGALLALFDFMVFVKWLDNSWITREVQLILRVLCMSIASGAGLCIGYALKGIEFSFSMFWIIVIVQAFLVSIFELYRYWRDKKKASP